MSTSGAKGQNKPQEYQFKAEKNFNFKHDLIKSFYKWVARAIAPLFLKYGINPNTITGISGVLGSLGAIVLLLNIQYGNYISAILLQVFIILDFVDGVVARKSNKNSIFGLWLDIFFDKMNDYLIIVCLTISVFEASNDMIYLLLGMVMMGSVFFTQFIFLLNDTTLKTVMQSRKLKTKNESSKNHLDKQKFVTGKSYEPLPLIKLILSQLSLNHAKFIAVVSIILIVDMRQVGMWIITIGSLLTLGMNLISNFRSIRKHEAAQSDL
jgi:phosphatidylglycerophosphate synthase